MKNLNIAKKLIFSFSVLILISIVIGVSGVTGLGTLAKAQEKMYSYNLVALQEIGNIRANYQNQRVLIRELALCQEGDEVYDKVADHLLQLETDMDGYIQTYKTTIDLTEDMESFNTFESRYNSEFKDIKQQLIAGGENGAIVVELIDTGSSLSDQMSGYLDTCLEANVLQAQSGISNSRLSQRNFIVIQIVILFVGFVIAGVIILFLHRNIAQPLTKMLFAARQLATGDVNVRIESKSTDEVGQLADAFQNMALMIREQTLALNKIAHGDLSAEITVNGENDMIGNGLKECSTNLNRIMKEINTAASQVSTGAEQVSESSQMLAQGTSEQAAAIEQLSSSIFEISLNTKEGAKMSESLAELFQEINLRAKESSGLMNDMVDAINAVKNATTSISKIMKLMGDISFQTKILSINAAVEAANAGEYGKGFAVVADEVRNLARRSAQAASDTEVLIDNCVQTVQTGSAIVQKSHEVLLRILQDVVESTRHIDDIAQATNEQSVSIEQINMGIDQVSKVINLNSSSAEQSAMAAEKMSAMAENLAKLVANFRLQNSADPITYSPLPEADQKRHRKPVIILEDEKSDKY
ncbi:MAG: methyl-accepting chemotaxis protein [Lachnospiraceae bacterium]